MGSVICSPGYVMQGGVCEVLVNAPGPDISHSPTGLTMFLCVALVVALIVCFVIIVTNSGGGDD